MQDKKLIDLCKSIYRKHKDAIDLILEWGMTSQFQTVAEEFVKNQKNFLLLSTRPHSVWFIPKDWKNKMKACASAWQHLSEPYPVACWFNYWAGDSKYRLGFVIEIGPMDDNNIRLKLVKEFKKKDFKIGTKAFREESRYTRVYSSYIRIEDPDDQDLINNQLEQLWQKSQGAVKNTAKILSSFEWK